MILDITITATRVTLQLIKTAHSFNIEIKILVKTLKRPRFFTSSSVALTKLMDSYAIELNEHPLVEKRNYPLKVLTKPP